MAHLQQCFFRSRCCHCRRCRRRRRRHSAVVVAVAVVAVAYIWKFNALKLFHVHNTKMLYRIYYSYIHSKCWYIIIFSLQPRTISMQKESNAHFHMHTVLQKKLQMDSKHYKQLLMLYAFRLRWFVRWFVRSFTTLPYPIARNRNDFE